MKTPELVTQIKIRMKDIEAAQDERYYDGKENFVIARVEELRDFLNLAHADAEIVKAAGAGIEAGSESKAAIATLQDETSKLGVDLENLAGLSDVTDRPYDSTE